MKRVVLILLILSLGQLSIAQITVTANQTAMSMAQTLVGQGVVMLNPVMNSSCPDYAYGKFDFNGNPSEIGIDSGIVLTTGSAVDNPGTFGTNLGISHPALSFASVDFPIASGDPDLLALINANVPSSSFPSTVRDVCYLEFDFIPAGDTVKFDYVMGSEEYTTFNCSINDIFGFFISGPGYTASQNIAIVPGTTNTMVGISTVNDGTGGFGNSPCNYNTFGNGPYTQFYNSNAGNQHIVYNGFTDVFTAVASVIPCDTYHLKLAIGDASDQVYDTGVFLKAGSLNSVGIQLTPESTEGHNALIPHCIRGCKAGKIKFSRPAARPYPLTIKYLIEGDAQMGYDFQTIADSIIIPAYEDSAILNIKGLLIPNASGPKDVIIKALSPYQCTSLNLTIIDSAKITIFDSLYLDIPTPPVTVCPNTEITITALIDTTLDYEWSPVALIPDPQPFGLTIHPKPTVPSTFTITATMPDAPATCPPVKRTYFANVEPIPEIILPSPDTTICISDSIDLNVYALPEGTNYQFLWSPASNLRDNFSSNNKFFGSPGNYNYSITATTPIAGCSSSVNMAIHVIPPFTFTSVSPRDTTIKYGDTIQLNSESDAIYWIWDPVTYLTNPIAKDPYTTPLESMIYTLIGINQYGCTDTAQVKINVKYESISGMPNAFSPNGDGLNDIFKIQNLKFERLLSFRVYNRWGHLVFETTDRDKGWDGTIEGKPAAMDTYYYYIQIALPGGISKNFKGDVVLVR